MGLSPPGAFSTLGFSFLWPFIWPFIYSSLHLLIHLYVHSTDISSVTVACLVLGPYRHAVVSEGDIVSALLDFWMSEKDR